MLRSYLSCNCCCFCGANHMQLFYNSVENFLLMFTYNKQYLVYTLTIPENKYTGIWVDLVSFLQQSLPLTYIPRCLLFVLGVVVDLACCLFVAWK